MRADSPVEMRPAWDDSIPLVAIGGAGSEVFRARARGGDRSLALRLWCGTNREELGAARERIERAIAVSDPTLAAVEGYEERGNGALWIVSEYVPGPTLDVWLARGHRLPVPAAIDLVRRLCSGLQSALDEGVSHDAIQPGNLVIWRQDPRHGMQLHGKLLDLGLAGWMSPEPPSLEAAHFVAPESLLARFSETPYQPASARANVYSCGALLYQLVTGLAPWQRDDVWQLMAAQESEDIVPASELNDHVCDALDCVIRGALAQRPSERYANPGELASVLASVELRHRRASQPPTLVQYDLASVHQPLAAQPLNSCAEHESESHAELGSESHAELGSESHAELGSELHAELGSESHAELGDEATAPNTIEAEPALAPIAWGAPTEARISIAPEPAIQATPRRMTGIGLPLLGALLSLAAYVVYPYVMPPRRHAAHRTAASAPVRAEASIAAPAPTFTSAAAVSGSEPVHPISEVKPAPSEVHFLQLAIDGAISPAAVRSGLERIRPALSSCYRHASDLAEQTRIPKLHVTFTIDETGHPRDARLTSGPASVDECVSQAVDKFASTPATTGTASVSTDLRFGS